MTARAIRGYLKVHLKVAMSAAVTTFEEFEFRTYKILTRMSRIRLALLEARIFIGFALSIIRLSHDLHVMIDKVRAWDLDKLNADQLRGLEDFLSRTHIRVVDTLRLAEEKGVRQRGVFWWKVFDPLQDEADRLADLLESIRLSTNDEFRQLVQTAISELHPNPEPVDWRRSLARLQD